MSEQDRRRNNSISPAESSWLQKLSYRGLWPSWSSLILRFLFYHIALLPRLRDHCRRTVRIRGGKTMTRKLLWGHSRTIAYKNSEWLRQHTLHLCTLKPDTAQREEVDRKPSSIWRAVGNWELLGGGESAFCKDGDPGRPNKFQVPVYAYRE